MPEVKSKSKSIAVRLIYIWGNQSWLLTSRMFPMDAVAMLAHAVVTVAALRLHAATGENLFYRVAKCRGSHGYISESRSSQIWKKLGTNCVSKLGHFANLYSSSPQNYRSTWPFQSTCSKAHIKTHICFGLQAFSGEFVFTLGGSEVVGIVIWYRSHSGRGDPESHIRVCICNSRSGSVLLPCCNNQLRNQSFKPINQLTVQKKVA